MKIRFKIQAIAYLLLLLFGATVGVSAWEQKKVQGSLSNIGDYLLPINATIADFESGILRYELEVRRLARDPNITPTEADRFRTLFAKLTSRLQDNFQRLADLLQKAIGDTRDDAEDRILLSQIAGSVGAMRSKVAPYVDLGDKVADLLVEGRRSEAVDELYRFETFQDVFGPDLREIRRDLESYSAKAIAQAAASEARNLLLGTSLFALAAVIGLAFSIWIAGQIIAALHQLITGAKAVERGELNGAMPVLLRDEIGQLTEAFNNMIEGLRAKEKITQTFSRYVDPRVVSRLMTHEDDNPDAAARQVATVFFSDVRGFSSISEQLTPASMVNLLNRYFTLASTAVREHHGIVDKYIGDSVMAFWTEPFSPTLRDQATDACRSALAHFRAARALRDELPDLLGIRRNLPKFTIRMGIATGDVVVGTVGSSIAKSFTVIGDTANLASRLEGINKVYGTRILIDERTYALAQDAIEAREIDLIVAAGQTEPIRIYQLKAEKGQLEEQLRELWGVYAEGLAAYRAADWTKAGRLFAQCLELVPDDGPSATFAKRVATLAANPPATWDAVWKMESK